MYSYYLRINNKGRLEFECLEYISDSLHREEEFVRNKNGHVLCSHTKQGVIESLIEEQPDLLRLLGGDGNVEEISGN
ncbi:hypothetical protein LCGC14_3129430 [marine sediment metagenome]|uniref:Uncharacterized protein n=1 Tax=marine sediment metagenome TaxID=412755 RepID=A0A0F8YPK9_9ZZZZ